ncbi:DNA-3-methyladenine glycosylase I [Tamilnaduibacter salinus]|uniref:DNA-3-methyladenine glycosylase I n=1 Tax=Tamilnaduibacter salinus TaxID=1484056 RepID=A0A2U1CY38_9GAMM|nr:DNA-3-methyladenine glycosylase I [Tamilnaduibacter salinus]PVY77393.1 DNA-3-methyladenine glycosylase I [Tamilnaduibacter salinus]
MRTGPTEDGRCDWCGTDALYVDYHDTVWGRPVDDERELFEKLCLDGQQAGLSWLTILRKQSGYQAAFDGFDPEAIARYDDADIETLLTNPAIVRNRRKVESIIRNARALLAMRDAGESFPALLWSHVDYQPIQNRWVTMDEVPAHTPQAKALSGALKRRGFNFVGPTIVYAFMQAVGMVNDHLVGCPLHETCRKLGDGRRFG